MTDRHVMIDIETLGIGDNAPLFQIGMAEFDFDSCQIYDKRIIHFDLLDVIHTTGFLPEPDTVKWWRDRASPVGTPTFRLYQGMLEVSYFLKDNLKGDGLLWANSPTFDLRMIKNHYHAIGLQEPWTYRQEADFRTVRKLLPILGLEKPKREENTHNALSDCLDQINHLWLCMETLRGSVVRDA